MNWKRIAKMAMAMPVVIVWDVTFFLVDKLHKGMSWIDEVGGNKIERWIEE